MTNTTPVRALRVRAKRCTIGHPPRPGWVVTVGGSIWLTLVGSHEDGPVRLAESFIATFDSWSRDWPNLAAALADTRIIAGVARQGFSLDTIRAMHEAERMGSHETAAELLAELEAQITPVAA